MEETTTTTEAVEQTSDAFLEGWDDAPEAAANQPEAEEQNSDSPDADHADGQEAEGEEQAHEGERPDAKKQEPETKTEPTKEPEKTTAPKTWELRHLDEVKSVDEAGMIALAQKGLDYDRIRERYDESKPVMELFGQFAKNAGMSVPDYVAYIRTQAKKANGMSEAEAKRAVDLEDREAAVAAKEAQQAQSAAEKSAAEKVASSAEEKRRADIAEFQRNFPEAAKEPDKIPPEVWAAVRQGQSLSMAYAKYSIKQAQEARDAAEHKAASTEQNRKNTMRSSGSMKTAGNEHKSRDPFLEGWDS